VRATRCKCLSLDALVEITRGLNDFVHNKKLDDSKVYILSMV
jgi:hypothetical protein